MIKIKRLFKRLLGYLPSKIPVGATEFQVWVDSFFETYDLPTEHRDSISLVLATTIIHNLGPQALYKPKYYFYLTIMSGAAKQVAGAAFYDIKTRQQQAQEAAAKAATESSNESIQN